METLFARKHAESAPRFSSDSFVFLSPYKSFITQGRFMSLDCPASDGADLQGTFQENVRHSFATAKKHGIKHPVLVGAIPFDTRKPSALFLPESWQSVPRQLGLTNISPAATTSSPAVTARQSIPDKETFMAMVAHAAQATEQPDVDKVVLSRLVDIRVDKPVDVLSLLARLIALNPTSYNFHVPLPDGGALLGASPELLLRKDGTAFTSLPLAGSARRESDETHDREVGRNLMNSRKDRYEHDLVTKAMHNTLKPRSQYLALPDRPELLTTPTLWHLATPIEGEVRNRQETALSLACLLHPTPALSGFPHIRARQLISALEPFDRELFGGMVGWCDEEGNGEWVVTIRCGRMQGHHIRLFAGAGVVPASSPEAEWNETGVKLSTMLHVFGLQ